jgi:hypothetical protein
VFDALNANVATEAWLQDEYKAGKVPKVVVLRHTIAKELNQKLAQQHCIATGQRMVMWHSVDMVSTRPGRAGAATAMPSPPDLREIVNQLAPNLTKEMLGIGYFFKGMCFRFTNSTNPAIGHMTNAECVGEALILHPDEPEDAGGPVRMLHMPPLAICVRPLQADVGDRFSRLFPQCPHGCIIIQFPTQASSFDVQLRIPMLIGGALRTKVYYRRRNFTLGVGYAFTDYFC